MTRMMLLLGAIALAGCSSSGDTFYERMGPMVQEQILSGIGLGGAAEDAQQKMSRAELEQIPYATISLQLGDGPSSYVVPIADNGGYLAYQDAAHRGITMHGGMITATHGFGYDLGSVAHQHDDPIFTRTAPAEWPVALVRSYDFRLRGQGAHDITVQCSFQRGPREFIEIAELRFETVQMIESCANPRRQFVNSYWVDPDSGFIWKSEQWVGPRIPPMTVEIIRPYRAS